MEIGHIIPHIEALLFASDKPLTPIDITELINNAFGFMEDKITMEQIQTAMEGIVEKYAAEFYPFELRESGGGWQFLTKKEFHKTVAQLNGEKYLKRLSSAALETLAIIAYKQPITKADIEAIRGVSCDYAVQKLLEKELIVITGRNENLPGKPLVYNTSRTFMDYFGINSPSDLPKLKEIFTESLIDPTVVNPTTTENVVEDASEEVEENEFPLVVTENGELAEEIEIEEEPGVVDTEVPEEETEEEEIKASEDAEQDTEEPGEEKDPNDQKEEN